MLTIWGRINSINVQKAVLAVEELGLAYERIDAGGPFGIVDTPAYRKLNPNGLVPTLQDGDFTLTESNAIVRYLATKAGALWPSTAHDRARADAWMDWQASEFAPAVGPAFMNLVRFAPDKRDATAVPPSVQRTEAAAALLDAHLAGRDWLEGGGFSVADLTIGVVAHRWLNMPVERQPRSNITRWYQSLMQRPAFAKVLTIPLT